MHILIADDEPYILELLARFFRSVGHTVQTAANGQAALDAFHRSTFDLVFTDLLMPKMDGLNLAKMLKAVASDLPIVLLTGLNRTIGLPANVDYLLEKPLRLTDLSAFLQAFAEVATSVP